ncbi:hypothetical protein Y695_02763 [Hydrogenophaga sp. T4]|nr:hypothetical protein Y695_02763 [Hydrogenophaga sp. T4]
MHLGIAMHGDIGQEAQQLSGTVAPRGKGQQLGRVFDESRGDLPGDEGRVVDQILEELQVGGHAADAELA